jgi:hypothetical protein
VTPAQLDDAIAALLVAVTFGFAVACVLRARRRLS